MKHIICNVLLLALYLGFFVHDGETFVLPNNGPTIEPVIGRFIHGESPVWYHPSREFSFVDIIAQKVCTYHTRREELVCAVIQNGPVGFVVPVSNVPGKFVVGSGTDLVLVHMPHYAGATRINTETLITVDVKTNGTRWNDAKADSLGRLWGGMIGPESNERVIPNKAAFYRINSDLTLQVELPNVTNSNGLVWNLQEDTLYYIDSATHQVAAFDFDSIRGSISNKRIVFDLEGTGYSGILDGMTIDVSGNLWIALYNGGGILNVDPLTGKIIQFVEFPVSKVTSCTFGGLLLDTLYVTTSSRDLNEQELRDQPLAGFVLSVKGLGVQATAMLSKRLMYMY